MEVPLLKPKQLLALLCLMVALAWPVRSLAQGAVVEILLFYSDSCPHCHHVMDEFLPPLLEAYGESVRLEKIAIDDLLGYRLFMLMCDLAGIPQDQRGVPLMVIGHSVLLGANQIEERFQQLVEDGLKAGGVDTLSEEDLKALLQQAMATVAAKTATAQGGVLGTSTAVPPTATTAPSATPGPAATPSGTKPIYLAYFYQPGCHECAVAEQELRLVGKEYPQLVIERYSSVDDAPLAEWLGEKYSVPEDKRLVAPAVFVGQDYLIGPELTYDSLSRVLAKYAQEGAPRVWEGWEEERARAAARVEQRFRSFGLLTVVGAGLIDGVNPCAFATLVFFISYLALTGRGKRQILATGIAFTAGVFATYLALGFGLYRLLSRLAVLSALGRAIYALTAVVCLAFAVLSLHDFLQARKGRLEDMRLRLPAQLRRRVNAAIRGVMQPGKAAAAAAVAGVVVSSVELACTGQVYLPTLIFVASRPELRASAAGALLLYNLAFILPLVVVFVVAGFGASSDRLRLLLSRHSATVKLLTAGLFLVLAGWLATMVI
jgi:cytochrome c biogenesis protein CcdA/thiol-disulfide isomerase/thioredoxin